MKNFIKSIKITVVACLALCMLSNIYLLRTHVASASESKVSLADGTHEKWIDRLDLTSVEYARDFYDWLVENTDNDGIEDALIDIDDNEQKITHKIATIQGSFTVDVSQGNLEDLVNQEIDKVMGDNLAEVADYCSMVYAAFNRDNNQVFWLKRELRTLTTLQISYSQDGEVDYTQEILMIIKSEDDADVADFDMRLDVYANGTLNIKNEITAVNQAVNNILADMEEASRYEKIQRFNEWLVKNNCYAKVITENSRDARGALLGQDGNSAYAPVCEGYARAFKVLCDRANIPCVLSSGSADGEEHMWNLVQMEDGNWYGVDVTWNDPTVNGVYDKISTVETDKYLLVGSQTYIEAKQFGVSHIETNKAYADKVAFDNGPTINEKAYVAPLLKNEWDVSKTSQDLVTAQLYQMPDHTYKNPSYKLIIIGNGEMIEYLDIELCPWKSYDTNIKEIEIKSGVTRIKGVAFKGCTRLKTVTIFGNLDFGNETFISGEITFICHENFDTYQKAKGLGYEVLSMCQITEWQTISAKDCENAEVLSGECSICGHVSTKEGQPATGHEYQKEYTFDNNSHWKKCKNCDKKTDIHTHEMSNWKTQTRPTTTKKGLKTRACDCGYEEQEEIAKISATADFIERARKTIFLTGGGILAFAVLVVITKIIKLSR